MTGRPRPILIAGPTASGKSALAVRLARERDGIVVNADSMQVYCELRVLTARPSPEEEAQAPHVLYGHVAGADAYSVARWIADVRAVLAKAAETKQTPIIVGGTGLYFKALLEGLSPVPEIPAEIRAHWRAEAKRVGGPALHAILLVRDRVMATRLAPGDTQRITRALEVLEATGRSLSAWQAIAGEPVLDTNTTDRLLVMLPRGELQARCDRRFDQMMHQGALDEVGGLRALNLDRDLPVMGALGVRPLLQHLAGEIDLGAAIAAGKLETRQYVKRQETWLKREMIAWKMDISF